QDLHRQIRGLGAESPVFGAPAPKMRRYNPGEPSAAVSLVALDRIYFFMLLSRDNLFNSAGWCCSNLVHEEAKDAAL
ncbi:MAG: hypothetical protein LBK44_03120, partial [Spirochaetales bacterium]|nr:hypothetical protein [Spirochaetales bacterium]